VHCCADWRFSAQSDKTDKEKLIPIILPKKTAAGLQGKKVKAIEVSSLPVLPGNGIRSWDSRANRDCC
jgi:hypothetical protein